MFTARGEEAAIQQYILVQRRRRCHARLPPSPRQSAGGIVWGDGVAYGTWWTGDPAQRSTASTSSPSPPPQLYLGPQPPGMLDNWSLLMAQTGKQPFPPGTASCIPPSRDRQSDAGRLLLSGSPRPRRRSRRLCRSHLSVDPIASHLGPRQRRHLPPTPALRRLPKKSGYPPLHRVEPGTTIPRRPLATASSSARPARPRSPGEKTGDAPGLCLPRRFLDQGRPGRRRRTFPFFRTLQPARLRRTPPCPPAAPQTSATTISWTTPTSRLFAQADRILCLNLTPASLAVLGHAPDSLSDPPVAVIPRLRPFRLVLWRCV